MKYIHGGWPHIFKHDRLPTDLRICFDNERNKLVAMEMLLSYGKAIPREDEFLDVEDSLKNANDAALESPKDYGLEASDTLPDWAQACVEKGSYFRPEDDESDENVFNNTRALSEGWDLFDVEGRIQLQRIDDPANDESLGCAAPKFASDADALIHVALQANAGSAYHRDAIERIGTSVD